MQLLDVDPQDQGEEDGAVVDLDSQRKGKCAVIKTSTRQVSFQLKSFAFKIYFIKRIDYKNYAIDSYSLVK